MEPRVHWVLSNGDFPVRVLNPLLYSIFPEKNPDISSIYEPQCRITQGPWNLVWESALPQVIILCTLSFLLLLISTNNLQWRYMPLQRIKPGSLESLGRGSNHWESWPGPCAPILGHFSASAMAHVPLTAEESLLKLPYPLLPLSWLSFPSSYSVSFEIIVLFKWALCPPTPILTY